MMFRLCSLQRAAIALGLVLGLGVVGGQGKIIWDGRAPLEYTSLQLDASADPYLTVVKGSKPASLYTHLMGQDVTATPLWLERMNPDMPFPALATEQTLRIFIGNSSVFTPGLSSGNPGKPQTGFRRTELIAQKNGSTAVVRAEACKGRRAYHFSVLMETVKTLDLEHEYQVVFVEPSDGSHIFGLQLGSPFTNPPLPYPYPFAGHLKVLDHSLNVLYRTPFTDDTWHNFAVVVDWDERTLQVWYSANEHPLKPVTGVKENKSVPEGDAAVGDFHFGLLKLPLVDPNDPPEVRDDVVYHGIQEGTVEGIMYSGVFIEDLDDGLSIGNGKTRRI